MCRTKPIFILIAIFLFPACLWAEDSSSKKVFANFMVNFSTPEISGKWDGWNYSNAQVKHNPNQKNSQGKPQVASRYLPLIGPYDMSDPLLAEYHCQLMKMAGIDGGSFDLGFYILPDGKIAPAVGVMQQFVAALKKYNLKAILFFEDKAHWIWNPQVKTREETVRLAVRDLEQWLALLSDVQYCYRNRPVVYVFSYNYEVPDRGWSRLSPAEVRVWKNSHPGKARPILLTQTDDREYDGVFDGFFEWPEIIGPPENDGNFSSYNSLEREMQLWNKKTTVLRERWEENHYTLLSGGVWPGFDDAGCWGWEAGHRGIDRAQGNTYAYHWNRIQGAAYTLVQIATWNDWFEGSCIEPSEEYTYDYLEQTRQQIARWKNLAATPAPNWAIPARIYHIRKAKTNPAALQAAEQACVAIQSGDFVQADKLIAPFISSDTH